jgi:tetratricopeptide (TPR) repeat protein
VSQYFALAIARGGKLVAKTAEVLGFTEDQIKQLSLLAREYEPRYLRNTYALGELYIYQGKMDKAEKVLKEVIEADPSLLPHFEPDNKIAQELARKLLEKHFQ